MRLSAYRSLFTLQPELKTELALSLYERGRFPWAEPQRSLASRGNRRKKFLAARGIEYCIVIHSPERMAEDVRLLLENR